jgi:hypothetical protein
MPDGWALSVRGFTLGHRGILFFDELTEFDRDAIASHLMRYREPHRDDEPFRGSRAERRLARRGRGCLGASSGS